MFFLPHILLFRKYVEYFNLILSFLISSTPKHSKTIDFSNDFSFDFGPHFDPNFSTLNRFETVQNGIFSLHQTAKTPEIKDFQGFFNMDLRGIEPLSESLSIQASPITVILLTFP